MEKNLKEYMKLLAVMAVCLIQPVLSFSDGIENIKAEIQVESPSAVIGSPYPLTLSIQYPDGAAVAFPQLQESIGSFEITKSEEITREKQGGVIVEKKRYEVMAFDAGEQLIPEMVFQVSYKGENIQVKTKEVKVVIESLVKEEADKKLLKEIKGPYDIPFSWKPYLPWLVAGFAVLLFILSVFYLLKKIKAAKKEKVEREKESPWDKALRLIGVLKRKTYATPSSIKNLYYDISLVTRHYIEERFSLAAPERTTEEFLFMLAEDSSIEERYKDILKRFLTECDKVKYARYQPTKNEINGILGTSEEFIKKTIPDRGKEDNAGI